jgi:hypothetical protein
MARTGSVLELNSSSSIVSGSVVRQLDSAFEALKGEDAPLVDLFMSGEALKVNTDWTVQWIKDELLPRTVTLASAWTTGDTVLTMSATDVNSVQVGQLIQFNANDEQIRVTANDGTTVTVTRAYGSTTATNIASGSTGILLLPAFADGSTFPESPKTQGEVATNYCIQALFELSETDLKTAQVNYLTKQGNELDYQFANVMRWAKQLLNNHIIYGRSVTPASGGFSSFAGLRAQISTNVTTVTGLLTPTNIVDTLELVAAQTGVSNMGDLVFMMTRSDKRIFDGIMSAFFDRTAQPNDSPTVSLNVIESFRSNIGTYNTMMVPQLKNGEILVVNKGDVSLNPIAVEGMGSGWVEFERDASIINARKRQRALSWIGTLKVGNEKRHAKITGFTSTVASYPSAI